MLFTAWRPERGYSKLRMPDMGPRFPVSLRTLQHDRLCGFRAKGRVFAEPCAPAYTAEHTCRHDHAYTPAGATPGTRKGARVLPAPRDPAGGPVLERGAPLEGACCVCFAGFADRGTGGARGLDQLLEPRALRCARTARDLRGAAASRDVRADLRAHRGRDRRTPHGETLAATRLARLAHAGTDRPLDGGRPPLPAAVSRRRT